MAPSLGPGPIVGPILVPFWPHDGAKMGPAIGPGPKLGPIRKKVALFGPINSHLTPSRPHLGPIVVPSWPPRTVVPCTSNIASRDSLLEALARVREIDGFGLNASPRRGKYSILLADIAIYWQLFRIFYTFAGLVPIRHDLFLAMGLCHIPALP